MESAPSRWACAFALPLAGDAFAGEVDDDDAPACALNNASILLSKSSGSLAAVDAVAAAVAILVCVATPAPVLSRVLVMMPPRLTALSVPLPLAV